jgi:hypothetical protein
MKPYCVFRADTKSLFDFGVPGQNRDRNLCVAYACQQTLSERPHDFDGKHAVYYADDEASANMLANHLANSCPGVSWVVAKSVSSFRAAPGPVTKGVYTDKGFFPATA